MGTQFFQASPLYLRLPSCLLPLSKLESALQMEPAALQASCSAEEPKLEDDYLIFFSDG